MWAIWAGTLSSTILEFITTFALWLLAERLHLSPILAIVAYAMVLARHAPLRQSARDRVHSYSVWAAAVFMLNVLAFLLMGLQARQIIQSLARRELWDALTFAGLVFLIVVVVRIVWVMSYRQVLAPLVRRAGEAETGSRALRMLVAWCGMRGILTLATAFSLPYRFPGRDVIVLSAFAVVLGTLVIQGSTVTLLLRWLRIPRDGTMDDDIRTGRAALARRGWRRSPTATASPRRRCARGCNRWSRRAAARRSSATWRTAGCSWRSSRPGAARWTGCTAAARSRRMRSGIAGGAGLGGAGGGAAGRPGDRGDVEPVAASGPAGARTYRLPALNSFGRFTASPPTMNSASPR
jgi:NhaP-type Na+/H+ or K+/H+ antiporter